MQMLKNKIMVITIAIMLTLTMTASLTPLASAHDPAWKIPTFAYVNLTPDPVGIGQTVFVVVWVDKMPAGPTVNNDVRFHNYKLTITRPDGTTETKEWPIVWDTTSSAYTTYTPDQLGTYTFFFSFPGQVYTWDQTTTRDLSSTNAAYKNDTYLPSNRTATLTVQQEQIGKISDNPLPTEYWSRPIEGQNTGWFKIASNWLGGSQVVGNYKTDGIAPNSPHIMWAKPLAFGGVVGGSNTGVDGATYYTGLSYEGRWSNPLIIQGRLYYPLPKGNSGSGNGYVCVDLQTGEQIFWQNDTMPTFASIEWYDSPNQHGVIPNGYLWRTTGTTYMAYDPLDGNWLFNVTNVPSGTSVYGPNGELLIYQLNAQAGWLAMWNFTEIFSTGLIMSDYRPVGKSINGSNSYTWNVTVPNAINMSGSAMRRIIYDDMILGSNTGTIGGVGTGSSVTSGTFWAISLKNTVRGNKTWTPNLLWTQTYTAAPGNITRSMARAVDPVARVFTAVDRETMQWLGYSLDNGNLLWGPVGTFRDFQYYGTIGSPPAAGACAYGNLYTTGYGGELVAFDLKTGKEVWRYNNTFSGVDNPWGLFPMQIGIINDGKVFVYTGEHSPNAPMYKGSRVRAINATTGEEIWTLLSWQAIGSFGSQALPVADGYISYLNVYDMQVYVVGKGPSALTVTAPDVSVELGKSLIIRGTVTDQSPGSKAKGTAAISDASMGEWMEYIFMQKPKPTNATGVPVSIDVVDSNGNYRNIGKTTSDSSGMFSYTWKPDIDGTYYVIATFAGSESYWPSSAETTFVVESPVQATPTPQTLLSLPPTEMYFAASTAAIIVAIAIVGMLILKKKP